MSSLRKFYRKGDVIFITTSVEKGLMFPPNALIELLLLSCLAKAQELYPVEVCHFIVEATHIHIIVYVHNPADIPLFMRYFKAESAHALNRLVGWKKNTIWCEGYDSPVLLLPEDVRNKITYLYSQPSKDNLAETIEKYQGISSWKGFTQGGKTGKSKRSYHYDSVCLARDDYPMIGHFKSLKEHNYQAIARKIRRKKAKTSFLINPNGWRKAFPYLSDQEVEALNEQAISTLRKQEAQFQALPERKVISRKRQVETPIGSFFQPRRVGKRMRCHCQDKDTRKIFLAYTSDLVSKAKEVYERWKKGDYSVAYPLGLFSPALPKVVEACMPVLREAPYYC